MYQDKTEQTIQTEMLDLIVSDVSKDEGTMTYDILSPVANQLAKSYIELDAILLRTFGQSSYGSYLDMRAGEFGIVRKTGSKASGSVSFTGVSGTVIPAGSLVQTEEKLVYKTLAQVTIGVGGSITATCEAESIGSAYNVIAGVIIDLPVSISGVSSVTNSVFTGGADIESDTDLRARLLLKAQTPPASGNLSDYTHWALETAGIGNVRVLPLWNGAGTVKVVLLDMDNLPASGTLVDDVESNIDAKRPVGATVTVMAATGVPVNLTANVILDPGVTLAQAQTNTESALKALLDSLAFKKDSVTFTNLGAMMYNVTGIDDYTFLHVNTFSNYDIELTDTQVATPGTVVLTEI